MNFLNDTENNQNAKNHNKTKFCVRVLQLLNETLVDHSKIKDIGLAWCQDGVHFICNSQILGNYINLKANSPLNISKIIFIKFNQYKFPCSFFSNRKY